MCRRKGIWCLDEYVLTTVGKRKGLVFGPTDYDTMFSFRGCEGSMSNMMGGRRMASENLIRCF